MPRADLVLAAVCFAILFTSYPAFAEGALTPARKSELIHLLKNDCGSCHGMTLKGSLGPSLLPQALANRGTDELRAIILNGVPGTPMPPWRGQLSETDTTFLVGLLQHGVPHE